VRNIRIGLVQLPWLGSMDAMRNEYRVLVAQAAHQGARIVCLPEFSLIPYFPSSKNRSGFDWAEEIENGPSQIFFAELARSHNVYIIGSLFENAGGKHFFDTATIISPNGAIVGTTRKVHIPYGEGYNETDFFQGGDSYPVYTLDAITVATPTCYDQWFPELSRIYALNGAEFIFYPTAIGSEPTDPTIDTQESWQTVMRGQAIANCIYIGAANRVGEENGVRFYGSSFVCDPMGRVVAQAGRDTTEVLIADLDESLFAHWRKLFPLLEQRRPDTYGKIASARLGVSSIG